MALIIDERVAGGRPQKRPTPSMGDITSTASRMTDHLRSGARTDRRPSARRALIWARA